MKLTVHEAAELLRTSERTVYRWIKEGAIPCQRINDHYRFHRAELLEWATARGLAISVDAFSGSLRVNDRQLPMLSEALRAGGVFKNVEGNDRAAVLHAVVKRMPLVDQADRELLFDVMMAREGLGSTGVGDGIAIPHVRSPIVLHASRPSITLCFLDHAIEFGAIDGRPVHTLFSLVTHGIRSHLHLLSRLSAALQDSGFRRVVTEQASSSEIFAEATRVDMALGREPEGRTA